MIMVSWGTGRATGQTGESFFLLLHFFLAFDRLFFTVLTMNNITIELTREEVFAIVGALPENHPTAVTLMEALSAAEDAADRDADMLPGEDMDGDFDSGMASAGYGTDEDYGYYGGGED